MVLVNCLVKLRLICICVKKVSMTFVKQAFQRKWQGIQIYNKVFGKYGLY